MSFPLPESQCAVQLTGPDALKLNWAKPVPAPGPRQMLCQVEAVGLCFSDLKLVKQFSGHVRKSEVIAGIDPGVLGEVPSYVPGELPTVPGHEAVVRIWAVGGEVTAFRPGERYLVQADYRWLKTAQANGALGYNFEGALQEYVLLDERVITSPEGESMLIPAPEGLSAAAVALVEPWACVEDAYAVQERRHLKAGGRMLVVAEAEAPLDRLRELLSKYEEPACVTWLAGRASRPRLGMPIERLESLERAAEGAYDDLIYFGARPETAAGLWSKVAPQGLVNIVQCGRRFGRPVPTAVGKVHYGGMRIIGTAGSDPAESMQAIPPSGEVRGDDVMDIIGAGGPMGAMHVIRDICAGCGNLTVLAGDLDAGRLSALAAIAGPLAERFGVRFQTYDPAQGKPHREISYTIVMAPAPGLVAQAVSEASERGIINIFAGIPAEVSAEIDLDAYIRKRLYFIGTSGSTLDDMRIVLAKVRSGALDTNLSVAAISGLEGALDGIRAVERREVAGKIIVYPQCKGLGLTKLEELSARMPRVAARLEGGRWCLGAEQELLATFASAARRKGLLADG